MIDFREIYTLQKEVKAIKNTLPGKLDKTGGTITGDLQIDKYLKINAWPSYGTGTINIWADKNNNGVLDIDGANNLRLNDNLVYHGGNKPRPADIGALPSGTWNISGQDLLVNSKRALVGLTTGVLHLSYGNDFTDVRVNNNKIFHEGFKPKWDDILNKPSIAAAVHTHDDRYFTESETETKLNAKLNTVGGTMTGNITFSTDHGVHWSRNTDGASITFKNTADSDTDSYMLFKTLDNGNEYFKFSSLNGTALTDLFTIKTDNIRFKTHQIYHEGFKPSWNDITSKPTSFTPATHTHDDRYFTESEINTKLTSQQTSLTSGKNYIHDTRGANRAPNYYARRETRFDFVESTHLGCGGDSWTTLLTASPWSSYSDTHRQQQLAFKGAGGLSFRYATSDTAWSGWQTIYSTINKPTWNDIQSKPSSFTPATHTHTYDTFGISNTDAGNKKGISLYGGPTSGQPSYGLMFSGTPGSGNNGGVTGDWATYFTMTGADTRGWIFKHSSTNVASVDSKGRFFANQGFFTKDMNCGLVPGNGDGSNNSVANIKLQSWFGIGFSPSVSGQTIPAGENAVYINCRSGDLTARGDLIAHKYARIYAYPGYGSNSANLWYHGNARLLAIENVDGIQLANSRNVLNDQDGRLYLNNGGGNANDMKGWKSARFANSTANRPYDWSSCVSLGGGNLNDTVQIAWHTGTDVQLAIRSTHDTTGNWCSWQRYSPSSYGTGGPNNNDGYENGAIYYQY